MRIGREFGELFCLRPLPASHFGVSSIYGSQVDASSLVWPHMAVLPMGCSWSLYFAQQVNESMVRQCSGLDAHPPIGGFGGHNIIVPGELRYYVYVDNVGIMGTDKVQVDTAMKEVALHLDSHGLKTHEKEPAATVIEALGVELDGERHRVRLSSSRYWRLDSALRWALSRRTLRGDQLEVLLGHCTFAAMVDRSLLSVFHTVYKFVRSMYHSAAPLWKSCRDELQAFPGALPLLSADWRLPWNGEVYSVDSSSFGYGVCTSGWPSERVADVARVSERSRFRRMRGGPSAREHALKLSHADPFKEPLTAFSLMPDIDGALDADWTVDTSCPEVHCDWMREELWDTVYSDRWHYPDPIHIKEARSAVWVLRRAASAPSAGAERRLILGDNMGVVLAFAWRRAHVFGLLRQVRYWSGFCMARNIRAYIRWVPSELNPADRPSRCEWYEPTLLPRVPGLRRVPRLATPPAWPWGVGRSARP